MRGRFALLPQLYRSLEREGVRDPLMSKLKGVYRHTWYGNQLRLRDAAVVLGELNRRGIEPMLLKGAALTLLHYRDSGLRPMEDVDVLVRTHQWRAAVDALTDLGWTPRVSVTPRRVAASHAMEFADAHAQRIDLHWHLLPDSCWPGADDEFWERASATALRGVRVSVLDATDQLLHTCAHGVKWEHVPPLRWIADAAMILGDPSVAIDWERLVRLADRLRLILPLRDALTHLESTLGLPVPRPVLAALQNASVSPAERWEYRLRTRPASRVLGRLQRALATLPSSPTGPRRIGRDQLCRLSASRPRLRRGRSAGPARGLQASLAALGGARRAISRARTRRCRTPVASRARKPVDFIVLSAMRSGSNDLQDSLNAHPEIECGGEVFNPRHLQIWGKVYREDQKAGEAKTVGLRPPWRSRGTGNDGFRK